MIVQAKAGGRFALRLSVVACAVACVLGPASAVAAIVPKSADGGLAPQLTQLAKPAVRSHAPAKQAALLGLPAQGPGSLVRLGDRVVVSVRFERGAIASRDEIRELGGRVLGADRRAQTATVALAPADLRALAAVPTVAAVTPVRAPVLYAVNCEGGSVISEGVEQLKVKSAREELGLLGEGITVGVLSDSFDQATQAADGSGKVATKASDDVETGDLPGSAECAGETTADVLSDFSSTEATDEGRAMAQIIRDVAPKAKLAFATAFLSEESFASNIEELAKAGADVIVDDVAYFEEPFFQDGPVATAIAKVTAEGVVYLSAAGNDNLFDSEGNEIASWEAAEYRDSGSCPAAIRSVPELQGFDCVDFDPSSGTDRTFGLKVEPEATLTVDLQWAESWNGVATDFDAFLLNANGELLAGATEFNLKTKRPVEILQWTNKSTSEKTVQVVVNRYSGGSSPRLKFALLQNGGGVTATEYPKSGGGDVVGPTVFGHAGSANAIVLGAVPYSDGSVPEEFSSRGPLAHYFGPVEGTAPAAKLAFPEPISKPDAAATDCGATTFFAHRYNGITWRFCGTSAAAPHAAGVVALMMEREPLATGAQIREALVGTAVPVGAFGPCAVGGGLIDALEALKAIKGEALIEPPASCLPPDSSGGVFVAPGSWGLESPPVIPIPEKEPTPPQPSPPPPAVAPTTTIKRHPPKVVRTSQASARVSFRFATNQPDATFLCKLDRSTFQPCASRINLVLAPGTHTLKVKARGATGLMDPSPAVFRFRVERKG
ncbi:MAG TPA: S8 family serine peptidase [Solirubrobacterales bacterium]|nr:S8 family serine peptidase [Solirubrobacterales bacterium]